MKKDNVLFGIAGLLLGAIIGFMFANSVNRNAAQTSALPMTANTAGGPNQGLPPGHPPTGGDETGSNPAGMQAEVQQTIDRAKSEPQNFDAQIQAANMFTQIGRTEPALPFLEAAAKLNPTDTKSLIDLGNGYFDADKFEEAEKWYTKALEKDPKNVNVRTDLGLTFFF
ncbi:MAG: tetratricopeptide repeat protein, partial [Acidobacteria bacterium]|nr:tetratricopeptide repeat protein [Acidobacteriota bacterium]